MKGFYLFFNLVVLGGPLLAVRITHQPLAASLKPLLCAYVTVALPWVILDAVVHARGWWAYNPEYIIGWRIVGLPFEEVLFFATVPFACAMTFLFLQRWWGDKTIKSREVARVGLLLIGGTALALGLTGYQYERTMVDVVLVFIALAFLWWSSLIQKRVFWLWNMAVLLLFVAFNSALTALPVVTYDTAFATGWRLGTIPVEDFLYNFSLLNIFLLVYYYFGKNLANKKIANEHTLHQLGAVFVCEFYQVREREGTATGLTDGSRSAR